MSNPIDAQAKARIARGRRRMNHADLIVARIERARQDRGISVAELARRMGVDRKRLWYVLNGQRSMRVDEFVRLCAVLNMGLGCFLTKEMATELAEARKRTVEEYGTGEQVRRAFRIANVQTPAARRAAAPLPTPAFETPVNGPCPSPALPAKRAPRARRSMQG